MKLVVNTTLTKREKLLLTVLGLILLFGGGIYYLLIPAYNGYTESKTTLNDLKFQEQTMDVQLASLKGIDQLLLAEQARATANTYFYRLIDASYIDEILQDTARSYATTPTAVTITDAAYADLTKYTTPKNALTTTKPVATSDASAANTDTGTAGDSAADTASGYSLPNYIATMTLTGGGENIVAVAQAINNFGRSCYVSGLTMTVNPIDPTNQTFTGTITINYYFLNQ